MQMVSTCTTAEQGRKWSHSGDHVSSMFPQEAQGRSFKRAFGEDTNKDQINPGQGVLSIRDREAILVSSGAIAQLGERYTGSVEVVGSIPTSSTDCG